MESGDEVTLGGPAGSSPEADGGTSGDAAMLGVEPAVGSKRTRVRVRDVPRQGSFGAWLICDTKLPNPERRDGDDLLSDPPSQRSVAGLCVVEWAYKPRTAEARAAAKAVSAPTRVARTFGVKCFGFLEYTVQRTMPLVDWFPLDNDLDLHSGLACLRLRELVSNSRLKMRGAPFESFWPSQTGHFRPHWSFRASSWDVRCDLRVRRLFLPSG